MKNITLAIDEETLRIVRRYAADHDTSVNALVREHLDRIAARFTDAKESRRRLLELVDRSTGDLGDWKWDRASLYER